MLRVGKWCVHEAVLTAALTIGSGAVATAPTCATGNMNCSWLGLSCPAFWGHYHGEASVWSGNKRLDNKHAVSSSGNASDGKHGTSDSGSKPPRGERC